MSYDFDLFVIGAGSGGIATARRAAEYGAKVGIAESDRLGGTCVNRGCVPKKLMVYAAHFPAVFEEAKGYGWSQVKSSLNWDTMITAVNDEVTRLNGIYQRMLEGSKVELFHAHASFVASHTIAIGDKQITAEKILIAVGGTPYRPNILGIEHAIVSDDIFNLKEQPKRLVILGGGYIGCEFACILNGMGSEVIQIIRGDKILRGFDDDIRTEIQQGMINHGIQLYTGAQLIAIEKTDNGVAVSVGTGDTAETVYADAVSLAAVGRKPNLHNLGLENTGVKLDDGAIAVNKYSHTAEDHIFAVGDCTNNVNLTPVAINEGRALADTVFGGQSRFTSYENIPTAVFTSPEAATVGLTEAEAREQYGNSIKIYRSKFRPMYYTLAGKDEKTLIKLIVDAKSDKVLGAHMVGDHAAEIIQGMAIALKMGATKANFDATIGIHPSSAEEFVTMRNPLTPNPSNLMLTTDFSGLLSDRFFKNFLPIPASNDLNYGMLTPDFVLPEVTHDQQIQLSSFRQQKPVILAFTRIFTENQYCPFCFPHLKALNDRYEEFRDRNIELLMITSTDLRQSKIVAQDLGLKMPLLSNPDCQVFRAYHTGQALGAPLPAQFLLDQQGRLHYKHQFSFLDHNASIETLLQVVKPLVKN